MLPILFSDPMVLAILRLVKWQTRRTRGLEGFSRLLGMNRVKGKYGAEMETDARGQVFVPCPYGAPGGRLWVRETWAHGAQPGTFAYRTGWSGDATQKWKPSIHLPRRASRIELDVTAIRVERLSALSEEDAVSEGIRSKPFIYDSGHPTFLGFVYEDENPVYYPTARAAYRSLWEDLNGDDSWALDPFVWVIDFKPSVLPAAQ